MKSDGSIFTLENEELLITVESHGAQLSRIYDKKAESGIKIRRVIGPAESEGKGKAQAKVGAPSSESPAELPCSAAFW